VPACYGAFMKHRSLSFVLSLTLLLASAIPSFAAEGVSGRDLFSQKEIETSGTGHSGLIVVFLSSKCPCSNSHLPELKSLAQTYPDFSFVAVHSNADEPETQAQDYFKSQALPFPVIQDVDSKLAIRFKALKTPHAFVMSPTGEILYQGGVSNSADFSKASKHFLRDALQDLKEHHSVRTTEGRTLGCMIKRS